MRVHPAAELFPMMGLDELRSLAADIKANGLQLPIELAQGRILDGRNRFEACKLAGVEPRFVNVLTASPVAYVISRNLHRRNMSPTQAASVAAKAEPLLAEEAKHREHVRKTGTKENLPESSQGQARDQAAKLTGVSGRLVSDAKKVQAKGSAELNRAMDADEVAASDAARIVDLPKSEQTELVRKVQSGEASTLAKAAKASQRQDALATLGATPQSGVDTDLQKMHGAIQALSDMSNRVLSLASTVKDIWDRTCAEVPESMGSTVVFGKIILMHSALSGVVERAQRSQK